MAYPRQHLDYTELDDAICHFLATCDGHATNSDSLCQMAAQITGGEPWRLIDRRMQAMRKSGRIKFMGNARNNPSGRRHGWLVCIPDHH